MGLNAFLVDFHGSGGSGGNETSIGFHEALDVAKAFEYAQRLPQPGPIVLYGASMGAAAVLKAVADHELRPSGLILESPFVSLIVTVRHRFAGLGIPAFPLADLLVFWGGFQSGFNALGYRPAESASRIDRPTLLMSGGSDPWVRPDETQTIFDGLRGPKTLELFAGVGHVPCLRERPEGWKGAVGRFLEQVIGASPPTVSAAKS
jgi:alpha-beta hydrolase superfamily lysophospholipase